MTISTATIQQLGGSAQLGWGTKLNSSSATALEKKGIIREDIHPIYGPRKFVYGRCDQSGGCTAGQVQSRKANTSAGTITAGTTTTITTSGLTADIHVDSIIQITDDAGAAGAAPEGENSVIIANTATLITVATDDAFSAAVASSDTATIVTPWGFDDSADGDFAWQVAGVAMQAQDQYDYGWFQFSGIHPAVAVTTAALIVGESLVADAAALGDGAADADNLTCGINLVGVAVDQARLFTVVDLNCGQAFKLGATA